MGPKFDKAQPVEVGRFFLVKRWFCSQGLTPARPTEELASNGLLSTWLKMPGIGYSST